MTKWYVVSVIGGKSRSGAAATKCPKIPKIANEPPSCASAKQSISCGLRASQTPVFWFNNKASLKLDGMTATIQMQRARRKAVRKRSNCLNNADLPAASVNQAVSSFHQRILSRCLAAEGERVHNRKKLDELGLQVCGGTAEGQEDNMDSHNNTAIST
jgi:hypothetical protein